MLFGVYHPKFVLVTTPSYTSSARFTASARLVGYPDPTGRTDRIFRHHDHKFEWTREEFTMYDQPLTAHTARYSPRKALDKYSYFGKYWQQGEKPPQANIAAFYNQAQLWFAYFCISWLWLSGAADTYICGRTTCQIQSEAIDIGLRKVPTWRSRSLDLLIVRLGWHINCRVRTSEQLSHVTSTSF